jgi:hypothetical protein
MIGGDCKLYYDSASSVASPTWVLIPKAQDVNLPDSLEEVEASARHSKEKKYLGGQQDMGIEFGYLYDTADDTVFAFLRTAYINRTPIQVAEADGAIATVGTTYGKNWYIVTSMPSAEELNGAKNFQITMKPTIKFNAGAIVDKSYTTVAS